MINTRQQPDDIDRVEALESASPRLDIRAFLQSAGTLSLGSIANVVRAVVTAKLLAVTLGPSQVGVVAQIFNFAALMAQIYALGLTLGVSKQVAEEASDRRRVSAVIGTASTISFVAALGVAAVLAPFVVPLSIALTGTSAYAPLITLVLASFPLFNLASALGYVLQGLGEIRRLTSANIAVAVMNVAVIVALVLLAGMTGAVAAALVTSVFSSLFFVVAIWRVYRKRRWRFREFHFSVPVARSLLSYGSVLVVGGIAAWGSLVIVRSAGIHFVGAYENGLYQVVNGLSTQYIGVFGTWMAAYVFPKVVTEKEPARLSSLVNSVLRANLLIMGPGLIGAIVLRDPLIRIFYAKTFLEAAPMLPVQVTGDFARVIGWTLSVILLAHGRQRAWLIVLLLQTGLWVALSLALIPTLGVMAIPGSYSISFVLWTAAIWWMIQRWFGFRLGAEQAALTAVASVGLAVACATPWFFGLLAVPSLPVAAWAWHRWARSRAAPVPIGT